MFFFFLFYLFFFFQAEDGIRYLVRSRGLGDVYKRQQHRTLHSAGGKTTHSPLATGVDMAVNDLQWRTSADKHIIILTDPSACLLYTSDAADERSSVDLGGLRII